MVRLLTALLTIFAFAVGGTNGLSNFAEGLQETPIADALYSVCWYEYLKVLPGANASQFVSCASTVRQCQLCEQITVENILDQLFKESEENLTNDKLSLRDEFSNITIPKEYTEACRKFADSSDMKTEMDMGFGESKVVDSNPKSGITESSESLINELSPTPVKNVWDRHRKDFQLPEQFSREIQNPTLGFQMNEMPRFEMPDFISLAKKIPSFRFSGLITCLMHQLKERHGNKALEVVVNEQKFYKNPKYIGYLMLKRDNEFRKIHGVNPFLPKRKLVDEAQSWAKQMASECKLYHSDSSSRIYNGEPVGENIASGTAFLELDPKEIEVTYLASNEWYNEIKNYPFPHSYRIGQELKGNIGNFAQTVWKNSEYVGYGYAYNKTCKQWFIVGRYFPAGNIQSDEQYKENVLPPSNWTQEPQT